MSAEQADPILGHVPSARVGRLAVPLFVVALLPVSAHAQGGKEGELADSLAGEARTALGSGRHLEAYRKARASFSLDPAVGTLCLLGGALYACWDFHDDCTGSGRAGDQSEAITVLGRCIAELEASPALVARHGQAIAMAKNHRLELQESGPDKPETGEAGSARAIREAAERARRVFAIWRNEALPKERRDAARASALERYEDLKEKLDREGAAAGSEAAVLRAETEERLGALRPQVDRSSPRTSPPSEPERGASDSDRSAAGKGPSPGDGMTPLPHDDRSGRRWLVAPLALGAAALATLGAGLGLYLSARDDHDALLGRCAPDCGEAQWGPAERKAQAGYALLAIGGAAVAADVVLWAVQARRRSKWTAWLLPAPGGLVVAGALP